MVAAAAIPVLMLGIGCSKDKKENTPTGTTSSEPTDENTAAGQPCGDLLKPASSAAALPSGIPAGLEGATFYEVQAQGATKRYFAHVEGDDLVKTRDTVKEAFEAAGIEIEGTDQEEGAEAEFEWTKGSNEGSVQVIHLCKDNLRVRYRIGPK
jgi:hypothetical protein